MPIQKIAEVAGPIPHSNKKLLHCSSTWRRSVRPSTHPSSQLHASIVRIFVQLRLSPIPSVVIEFAQLHRLLYVQSSFARPSFATSRSSVAKLHTFLVRCSHYPFRLRSHWSSVSGRVRWRNVDIFHTVHSSLVFSFFTIFWVFRKLHLILICFFFKLLIPTRGRAQESRGPKKPCIWRSWDKISCT